MGKRTPPPVRTGAILHRRRSGAMETLIVRWRGGPYAERWTFPGGEVEPKEAPEVALRRAIGQRLGVRIEILAGQPPFDRQWEGQLTRWRFYFCDVLDGEPTTTHYAEARWVPQPTLCEYDFDPVSQQVADWLLGEDAR